MLRGSMNRLTCTCSLSTGHSRGSPYSIEPYNHISFQEKRKHHTSIFVNYFSLYGCTQITKVTYLTKMMPFHDGSQMFGSDPFSWHLALFSMQRNLPAVSLFTLVHPFLPCHPMWSSHHPGWCTEIHQGQRAVVLPDAFCGVPQLPEILGLFLSQLDGDFFCITGRKQNQHMRFPASYAGHKQGSKHQTSGR